MSEFGVADEKACAQSGGQEAGAQSCGEKACGEEACGEEACGEKNESEQEMSESPNRASALAELAALAENVERCRERIVALAESLRLANHDPKKPENNDDGLLMAIYEAERGLISATRLLQRAARTR